MDVHDSTCYCTNQPRPNAPIPQWSRRYITKLSAFGGSYLRESTHDPTNHNPHCHDTGYAHENGLLHTPSAHVEVLVDGFLPKSNTLLLGHAKRMTKPSPVQIIVDRPHGDVDCLDHNQEDDNVLVGVTFGGVLLSVVSRVTSGKPGWKTHKKRLTITPASTSRTRMLQFFYLLVLPLPVER